jgi:hypothetical protein
VGKLLVFGAVLGVLGPCLAIAAGLLARSPFLSTQHMEGEQKSAVEAARRRLRGAALRSDHLVLASLLQAWDEAGSTSTSTSGGASSRARQRLCGELGLSWERVVEMGSVRRQLQRDMEALGFHSHSGADHATHMLTQVRTY